MAFYKDYPFVAPSTDIRGMIDDLFLSFDDVLDQFVPPFSVTVFSRAPNGVYSVVIQDSEAHTVFDSSDYSYSENTSFLSGDTSADKIHNLGEIEATCKYSNRLWGSDYRILQWETPFIALYIYSKNTPLSFTVTPENGELDSRSISQLPKRIRQISVGDTTFSRAALVFKEGNNCSISSDDVSDSRMETEITLNAVAGAGLGKVEVDCDEIATPITSVNGAIPDSNGTLYVITDGCHAIKRSSDGLILSNECKPCCACQDMTDTAAYLEYVAYKYYALGDKTMGTTNDVKELAESLENNASDVSSIPFELDLTLSEYPNVWVKVYFRNVFYKAVSYATTTLTFSDPITVLSGTGRATVSGPAAWSATVDAQEITFTPTSSTVMHITWSSDSEDGAILPNDMVYAYFKAKIPLDVVTFNASLGEGEIRYYGEDTVVPVAMHIVKSLALSSAVYKDYTNSEYMTSDDLEDTADEIRSICRGN